MTIHKWTLAQEALLREIYPYTRTQDIAALMGIARPKILSKAYEIGVRKSREAIAEFSRQAMANPDHPGRQHLFHANQTPWNKGTNFQAGGRSAETQFRPGRTPLSWQPIGHERISKDGYLQRKVTDTGVSYKDYVFVHRLNWLAAGNEILPGHLVKFKDGNKENPAVENLYITTRADNMRANSVHQYGPEIASLAQLQGAITRQINKRQGKYK